MTRVACWSPSLLQCTRIITVPAVCIRSHRRYLASKATQYSYPTREASAQKGPLALYNQKVADNKLNDDLYQRAIVRYIQRLYNDLESYHPPQIKDPQPTQHGSSILSSFKSLFGSTPKQPLPPKGIYLYGDVGCGKTMLMDLFYDSLAELGHLTRLRIHFHKFMQDVHHQKHNISRQFKRGSAIDPLPLIAANLAKKARVLCFDEFQVTDVADAMILRSLIENLEANGVVLFMTSNRAPDELYKNGVQRENFIPCIELLKQRLKVLYMDSPTDYRKVERPMETVYFYPLDQQAQERADWWFHHFADPAERSHPRVLKVWGRDLKVNRASGKVAEFNFMDLCGKPLSSADYLELTNVFDAFIVTDIPVMTLNEKDLARRFITFIDAVYERHCKLVCTMAAPFENLFIIDPDDDGHHPPNEKVITHDLSRELGHSSGIFSGEEEVFAFARTLSRLRQMETRDWIEAPTRN